MKTTKANKINVVANTDTTNANSNVSYELQEYTQEVIDSFDCEKFCHNISYNVMLKKLLDKITNTNISLEEHLSIMLFKTYNIVSTKEQHSRNYNLKHVIQSRISTKETAKTDTTNSFTLEEVQQFYNDNIQTYTEKQIYESLVKNKVSKDLINKVCKLQTTQKSKLTM
jgi:hypothetical protein